MKKKDQLGTKKTFSPEWHRTRLMAKKYGEERAQGIWLLDNNIMMVGGDCKRHLEGENVPYTVHMKGGMWLGYFNLQIHNY